jgi:hypothetical protein
MVLPQFPIESHPRPMELLGGLALIPLRGNESSEQPVALGRGWYFDIP